MIEFFSSTTKRIREVFESTDKRYKYELYLISCYFDPNSAVDLIKHILTYNNLSKINIFIDRNEAYKIGYENVKHFLKRIRLSISMRELNTEVIFNIIKGNPGIFHSKIYALINHDKSGKIKDGKIIIGSANLTRMGLMAEAGNIETIYTSTKTSDLKKFIADLNYLENKKIDLENLYKFDSSSNEGEFDWQYAFLKSGYFIHKWSDSLATELSLKFSLSEHGKLLIQNDTLQGRGFNNDTKTISKNYFNFENLKNFPAYLGNDKDFLRKHGLEVNLGFWVPKGALPFENSSDFAEFKIDLIAQLKDQQKEIQARVNDDISWLKDKRYIEIESKVEHFSDKFIDSIENNDFKIYRIYTKYEVFEMPYDFSQEEEVILLYDDLFKTKESKQSKHVTNRIDRAVQSKNLLYLVDTQKYFESLS